MDPAIWSRLPEDLVNKICNMIPMVMERNNALLDDIRFQTHKYSRWYYNTISLFGFDNAYFVMYDDLRNVLKIPDTFPEVITIDLVVEGMWRNLTHEQRDEIILSS